MKLLDYFSIGSMAMCLLLIGTLVGIDLQFSPTYHSEVEDKSYPLSLPEEIELLSTDPARPDTIVAWNKNDTLVFRYVVSERYWQKQCLKYCK